MWFRFWQDINLHQTQQTLPNYVRRSKFWFNSNTRINDISVHGICSCQRHDSFTMAQIALWCQKGLCRRMKWGTVFERRCCAVKWLLFSKIYFALKRDLAKNGQHKQTFRAFLGRLNSTPPKERYQTPLWTQVRVVLYVPVFAQMFITKVGLLQRSQISSGFFCALFEEMQTRRCSLHAKPARCQLWKKISFPSNHSKIWRILHQTVLHSTTGWTWTHWRFISVCFRRWTIIWSCMAWTWCCGDAKTSCSHIGTGNQYQCWVSFAK